MNTTKNNKFQLRTALLAATLGLGALGMQACDFHTPGERSASASVSLAKARPLAEKNLPKRVASAPLAAQASAQESELKISAPIASGENCVFEGQAANASWTTKQTNGDGELPKYLVQIDFDAFSITREPLLLTSECDVQFPLDWTPGYRVAVRTVATSLRPTAANTSQRGVPMLDHHYQLTELAPRQQRVEINAEGSGQFRFENDAGIQSSCSGRGAFNNKLKLHLSEATSPDELDIKLQQLTIELELIKPPANDKDCEKEKGGL